MRPYEKHIDKVPGTEEVQFSIDEREDLEATKRISVAIQQILDV